MGAFTRAQFSADYTIGIVGFDLRQGQGRDDSIDAMAARLGVRRDYLAVLVRLSYLSPEIVRAILVGQQPIELTPTRLVALSRNLPYDWQEQWRLLGFAPA